MFKQPKGLVACEEQAASPLALLWYSASAIKELASVGKIKVLPGHHDVGIPVSLIKEIEAGFAQLVRNGQLKQGNGLFEFRDFQIQIWMADSSFSNWTQQLNTEKLTARWSQSAKSWRSFFIPIFKKEVTKNESNGLQGATSGIKKHATGIHLFLVADSIYWVTRTLWLNLLKSNAATRG